MSSLTIYDMNIILDALAIAQRPVRHCKCSCARRSQKAEDQPFPLHSAPFNVETADPEVFEASRGHFLPQIRESLLQQSHYKPRRAEHLGFPRKPPSQIGV